MQFSSNERKALCAIPKLGLHLLFLSFSILTNLSHANTLTQNAALALIDENGHAVIPNGYTSIDGYAFSGATSLASIIIPDSVTSISGGAFYGATSLTSIVIPDSVTSISSYAFYGATSLASVSLGSGITSIGNGAFYGAPSLASIVIPDSVTSIGENADTYDDGDGILDEEEVRLGTDSLRADSDVDGDGVGNNADVFDSDPLEWFDTDANGVGNNADTDDDGDGYSDLQEVIDGTDSLNALDCKTCPSPVSGLVYHWRTQALLASVDLALVGLDDGAENAFSDDAVTNTSGSYAFTERHGGTNRLTVTKAMTANESGNVISSADALAALKIAVGINPNADPDGAGGPREALPVSPYQYIAADVTGDGRVTSADALDILKMAVNLNSAQARRWLFVSEDYDFWDETANDGDGAFKTTHANVDWEPDGIVFEYPESTTKNIVGILMGDVTGDWSEPAGSARLDEDHLSRWLASFGGSLAQLGLVADTNQNGSNSGTSSSDGSSKDMPEALKQAAARMIADGMNVPTNFRHADQGFAVSTTLKQEFIDRYNQAHDFIQPKIGGYPNWNTVITDEDGADSVNQAVFQLLGDVGFDIGFEGLNDQPWTTQRVLETAGCLTGSEPQGLPAQAGGRYVAHSLCMLFNGPFESEYKADPWFWNTQDLEFPEGQYYHRWALDFGFLDGQYHEYFHHFQRAHQLTADASGVSDEPFDPHWWAEGSGQFAGWFYRDHWRDIEFLQYLDPDHSDYANYWETRDWSIGTPNSRPPYLSLQDHLDYMVEMKNKSFFFAASQVQNAPNKLDGVGNAFIPSSDNCYGWIAQHDNTAYYPSDERYQYAPGQQSCWAIMFVAGPHFLAYKSSWQAALRDIPADYYELGFWGSVEKHTGLNKQQFFTEFNALLRSVDAEKIDPNYAPEGWNIPDEPMSDIVDFLNIDYYRGY